jgi:hypothetical protein
VALPLGAGAVGVGVEFVGHPASASAIMANPVVRKPADPRFLGMTLPP